MGNTMLMHLVIEQTFSRIMSISDAFSFSLTWFDSTASFIQTLCLLIYLLIRIILHLELQRVRPVFIKLTYKNHYQTWPFLTHSKTQMLSCQDIWTLYMLQGLKTQCFINESPQCWQGNGKGLFNRLKSIKTSPQYTNAPMHFHLLICCHCYLYFRSNILSPAVTLVN